MQEQWEDIKDYKGLYKISNMGRVKSLEGFNGREYIKREKILKPHLQKTSKNGKYLRYTISLYKNKKRKQFKIHQLVAQAFIPNPQKFTEINHIDSDPLNNSVDNLEWCTHQQNMNHSAKKLTRNIIKNKDKIKEIIKAYEKNDCPVDDILKKYNLRYDIFYGILKRNKVKIRHYTKYKIDREKLKKRFKDGVHNKEIAREFNCPSNLIAKYKQLMKKGLIV